MRCLPVAFISRESIRILIHFWDKTWFIAVAEHAVNDEIVYSEEDQFQHSASGHSDSSTSR